MNCRRPVCDAIATLALLGGLTGCATGYPDRATAAARGLLQQLMPTPLLLLGEQHDATEHQALQAALVRQLGAEHTLAALVIEMAEAGDTTVALPPTADDATVRRALRWDTNRQAWPWPAYGPAIMAAVRAGVPVLGGNLPAVDMGAAMVNVALDSALGPGALRAQQTALRKGHCGLLPESQIAPMTRIQIARDQSLARTAVSVLQPGKTVLLVAGNQHVRRDLGAPLYLPAGQPHRTVMSLPKNLIEGTSSGETDRIWSSPALAPRDHCAEFLRQQPPR